MKKTLLNIYSFVILTLALISILLVVFDFVGVINIDKLPWLYFDNSILLVFTVDYFTRLFISKNKWTFFKQNIFDLLAILPFYSAFSFFRFARIMRIMRFARAFRFVRLIGFIGKAQRYLHDFLKTNGFIYLIWTSLSILILSATLYSLAEGISWGNSLWWALTTATTVGYGDISPHTVVGKIAAILLMIVGIGFIGSLTSALTTFFTQKNNGSRLDKIYNKLEQIENENIELKGKIDYLEKRLKK
ncbi:ion transporter [Lentilactobacillus hilgardii]|uniref:ion transporter n=1 Tax=Lentilactobacillus hilgardii TaxID=1588 RepID=UPI0021C3FFDC|nr:potassium channel family protein [Lentilactobacillus hilgardii]MCP9331887.1 ion transporter [Lentilactobacillus hilgardii]MCP9348454.1 ion transporter [Lentilactobacillus hilgardii]MCP9351302.1 ion transporter [Lentilactobacillus hilgardii]